MHISIAERFRPFSTEPGIACLLPLSQLSLEIFPTFISVKDLSKANAKPFCQFPLMMQGPVKGFTVQQDLEKSCLRVWGFSREGFFRYRLHATSEGFCLIPEKLAHEGMFQQVPQGILSFSTPSTAPEIPRLSFGVTKKADWTLVNRRFSLEEILPFWFRLGQLLPATAEHAEGTAKLLDRMEQILKDRNSIKLTQFFEDLYLIAFHGLLNCSLLDCHYQGYLAKVPADSEASPLLLLTKGAELIKKMLVQVQDDQIEILPCLLPKLHAGRFCQVPLGDKGSMDLEWSKKKARRLIFKSHQKQVLTFSFQKELKTFRLRKACSKVALTQSCGAAIHFEPHTTYWLDRFEH